MSRNMPPEWATHARTWMGLPPTTYPGTGVSLDDVQAAWSAVANAIVDHEPVHMLCHPDQLKAAERRLSGAVTVHGQALDDAWLRDSGPTFVVADGKLTAIDWRFNGWGDNTAAAWALDAQVAKAVAVLAETPVETSQLTNEGGGLHVDGTGRVLLTETVQLDPDRNPDWSHEAVEAAIHAALGTRETIWLPRGLTRDYADHGTRGHVDMVACFTPDGRVLLHQQQDSQHPDFAIYTELADALHSAGLDILSLPAPATLRDNVDWVDYSYINHYVLNGAVIVPTFDDARDGEAIELLAEVYRDRAVIGIDARCIFAMGGGVHCITQQEPLLTLVQEP